MVKKNVHVVPHSKGWAVKREGNERATKVTKTKDEATRLAKEIAKKNKTELIIHGKDGKFIDKDSFGNDPHPPIDKKH